MTKSYPGEQWKTINFDFEYTNDFRIEVSNFGRIRTFNKISDGNILNGSMINGYRIIRLKLYHPRDEKVQEKLDSMQQKISKLASSIKQNKLKGEAPEIIEEASAKLAKMKKALSKKFQEDLKSRTINHHFLVHRIVAEYFLKPPAADETIVAHKDHDKVNNRASNLQWMTPEKNYEHQKKSPLVIEEKNQRKYRYQTSNKVAKLTVTKVMLLKKYLNQGKPMKQLVKYFKITDTQILRIKRGENWSNVPPAS